MIKTEELIGAPIEAKQAHVIGALDIKGTKNLTEQNLVKLFCRTPMS